MDLTKKLTHPSIVFAKEWGGVITIIIAVAYTLPSSVYDRISNFLATEKDREFALQNAARDTVSKIAALRMEEVDHLVNRDPDYANLVHANYDYRVYNLTVSNIELFESASAYLKAHDLYGIAGTLAFAGETKEAEKFYEKALTMALTEGVYAVLAPTMFSDIGGMREGQGNLRGAREAYIGGMKLLSAQTKPGEMSPPRSHFLYEKAELAGLELDQGDFQCGMKLAQSILPEMQKFQSAGDQFMAYAVPLFMRRIQRASSAVRPTIVDCPVTPN